MDKKKFFILDGSSLLYRAFYALPLLETENGVYTNAIVGFSNMLFKLLTDWRPSALVIAFDKGKHTFRTDMFADYKATRKPMPEELRSQVPLLHEMAAAWNIPLVEMAGFEADDIIGTLANKAVAHGMSAYVVTGDRDALQLVKPDLTVLFTKKGISDIVVYDVDKFQAEYQGLDPIQLIDLKGLMGDSSDNIPGVPKVGPKTAMKLLAAYGSVEQFLLHIAEISGKALQERLSDNQQQALLSKKLATIRLDVPVAYQEAEFALDAKAGDLTAFYQKYQMRSLARQVERLSGIIGGAGSLDARQEENRQTISLPQISEIASQKDGRELYQKALQAGRVSIIGDFQGKVPHKKLIGAAVAFGTQLYYCPMSKDEMHGMDSLFGDLEPEASAAWSYVLKVLADDDIAKYLHDAKSFYHAGIQLSGKVWDASLMGYLLNPSSNKYAMRDLLRSYGAELQEPEADWSNAKQLCWQCYGLELIGEGLQKKLMFAELSKLYEDIEFPLVQVLAAMEQAGVYLNRESLVRQSKEAGGIIAALEQEIYKMAGRQFNIASPKQLGVVLFEELELPVIKKTKTGYSTNVEVLNELYNYHPIIEKILAYRQWTKLKSTYMDGIAPLIDTQDGRVHTSFNQTATATGRLSSSDPNLQNIPIRRQEGRHIREMFEPGEGYDLLLSADYSQIELRVLADMSEDENFLRAFRHNEDVHARTAAEVFGVPVEAVDAELRRKAKAVNFGIIYGMSDFGLSQDLHISRKEAKEYINKYFAKCQGVKAFIDRVVTEAHDNGYVLTKFGRRRDLPEIRSTNYQRRSLAERMAMNTPIQGTAADIIKLAMIRTYRALQEARLKSRMLLQVHDELVLEVPKSELSEVKAILKESMEQAAELRVPLTIDINAGKNWAEAK